jgi:Zn-finger nucleic acid-binding protein
MPYLRCPNCGLLAHMMATAEADVVHCPRCRGGEEEFQLAPLEESLRHVSAPPGAAGSEASTE